MAKLGTKNIDDFMTILIILILVVGRKMIAAELAESKKSAEAFGQRFTPQETSGIVCNLLRSLQGGKEC